MSNNDGCRRTHDTVQDPVREKLYPRDGVIARFLKVTAQNNDSFFCRNYPLNCFEWSTAVISCKQTARFCVGNATKQNKFEIQSRSNSIQSPYQMCSRPCHSWGRLGTRWLGHAHLLVKIKDGYSFVVLDLRKYFYSYEFLIQVDFKSKGDFSPKILALTTSL